MGRARRGRPGAAGARGARGMHLDQLGLGKGPEEAPPEKSVQGRHIEPRHVVGAHKHRLVLWREVFQPGDLDARAASASRHARRCRVYTSWMGRTRGADRPNLSTMLHHLLAAAQRQKTATPRMSAVLKDTAWGSRRQGVGEWRDVLMHDPAAVLGRGLQHAHEDDREDLAELEVEIAQEGEHHGVSHNPSPPRVQDHALLANFDVRAV